MSEPTMFPAQDSLTQQVCDLLRLGDQRGLYDATDWVREVWRHAPGPEGKDLSPPSTSP